MPLRLRTTSTLDSISAMYAALRACWVPPPKDAARHGMEYTMRFAFKRDGEIIAPPRRTYSSHDAPAEVRDLYRDAVDAALTALHAAAFQQGHGRRRCRPPDRHPLRRQPDHRRRKRAAVSATARSGRRGPAWIEKFYGFLAVKLMTADIPPCDVPS